MGRFPVMAMPIASPLFLLRNKAIITQSSEHLCTSVAKPGTNDKHQIRKVPIQRPEIATARYLRPTAPLVMKHGVVRNRSTTERFAVVTALMTIQSGAGGRIKLENRLNPALDLRLLGASD